MKYLVIIILTYAFIFGAIMFGVISPPKVINKLNTVIKKHYKAIVFVIAVLFIVSQIVIYT